MFGALATVLSIVLSPLGLVLAAVADAASLGGSQLSRQAAKIDVQGTFNAAAAAGLAAGGAAERTAKGTEETARNTKKLVNKAQQGGLTFG